MNQSEPSNERAGNPRKLSTSRKLLFAALFGIGFFVVVEGLLRVAGFKVAENVETMEFTFPIDDYNQGAPEPFLERDPELFWKPRAGVAGHNSLGLYGPEFSPEKPDEVLRILCLGDSCTHFGPRSYPHILQERLDQMVAGPSDKERLEVINAGVIGYTSYQGRKVMETRAAKWEPDIVTVYFGWNDHWLARGLTDREQTAAQVSGLNSLLGDLRSVQFARLMTGGLSPRDTTRVRVPIDDYRENLLAIHQQTQSIGSECWFMTAPHAMDLSIPAYLVTSGEVADPSDLIPMHQRYNAVVRDVAKETGSTLIDLEMQFDQMQKAALFLDDH
ncbi:MAG: GDSL-type esterase/lipase family protein, partial [Planctomycetota bacterium]